MRAIVLTLAVLAVPARVSADSFVADSFVEVAGGFMAPAGDEDWTDLVETSPKLALRVGGTGSDAGRAGAMLSVDWTPVNLDNSGGTVFGVTSEASADRFRILLGGYADQHLGSKLTLSVRAGLGVDISHVSGSVQVGGFRRENSDTDPGFAIEVGGGLWFDVGSVQVGGEVGLPFGFHADGDDNDIDIADYMSYDIDLLFGVRLVSR